MLMGEDIIFNVISGVGPFSHELYRHMFEIMNALEMPYDMHNCISLYKVLPCTKDEFQLDMIQQKVGLKMIMFVVSISRILIMVNYRNVNLL